MMLHPFRQLIPSMYHRRLLLLALVIVLAIGGLGWQMGRLTLAQGPRRRAEAEAALSDVAYIPTVRGRIFDRQGTVLAQDKPCYDLAVRYPVISGQWAYEQAQRDAIRLDRQRWRELDAGERERLIAQFQPRYEGQVEDLWQTLCALGGISRAELEDRKETIKRRVFQTATATRRARLEQRAHEAEEPLALADVAQPIGEQLAPHAVLFDVDDQALLRLNRLIDEAKARPERDEHGRRLYNELAVWRTVTAQASKRREYPFETMHVIVDRGHFPGPLRREQPQEVTVEGVALHLVGSTRRVQEEDGAPPFHTPAPDDPDRVDLRGYLPGDSIGGRGIEKSLEAALRGTRGQERKYFDSGAEERTAPQPGQDVTLSLDIRLQARIQAIMMPELGLMQMQPWHSHDAATSPDLGRALNGAAVVLDIASGEILAAVTVPGYGLRQLRDAPDAVWGDKLNQPYLNRALGVPYQPGSTAKPVVLCAAVTEGRLHPGETVTCNGFLDPRTPEHFRCWIYRSAAHATHGPLAGPEALARSCNIFFYTMGRRLGPERLVWWYDRFGLGHRLGLEVEDEVGGWLSSLRRGEDGEAHRPLGEADAINMGIGQGPVAWTVVQAANCYATIARGGYALSPTLLHERDPAARRPQDADLQLNPEAVRMALQGLDEAVNQRFGTGNHLALLNNEPVFTLDGVKVLGKSGTAETTPQRLNGQIVREGDHAWFIGLVRRADVTQPQYVVAVLVEHAGSGGATAGPIANQILYALRAGGYL